MEDILSLEHFSYASFGGWYGCTKGAILPLSKVKSPSSSSRVFPWIPFCLLPSPCLYFHCSDDPFQDNTNNVLMGMLEAGRTDIWDCSPLLQNSIVGIPHPVLLKLWLTYSLHWPESYSLLLILQKDIVIKIWKRKESLGAGEQIC